MLILFQVEHNWSSGKANILPGETKLHIKNAFCYPKSHKNLLSFKDIHLNGYHMKTNNERNMEYLYIMKLLFWKNYMFFSYALYYMNISTMGDHNVVN